MSILDEDFDNASVAGPRYPFLNQYPGSYVLEIVTAELKNSNNPKKRGEEFFRTDVKVISGEGSAAMPVGDCGAFLFDKDEFGYNAKDLKALIAAVLNRPPSVIKSTTVREAVDSGELPGTRFKAMVYRPDGKNFNKTIFASIEAPLAIPTK